MRLNSEVKMYDNDDPRVKKIVIDYANRNGEDIQWHPDNVLLTESHRYDENWVFINPYMLADGTVEEVSLYRVTVDEIVTDAILDLLAKG